MNFDHAERQFEWRYGTPPDSEYDYDEYCQYVDDHPTAGYDAGSVEDYERWCHMMEEEAAEVSAETAAERRNDERDDDDRAYWGTL